MAKDWVDDEGLSREETLKRFEALNPQPTETFRLPSVAVIGSAPRTYTGVETFSDARQVKSPFDDLVSNGRMPATA